MLVNAEDGPAFEKAETVVDLINDYTITGGTVVDFDGDANLDIVMAGYDESENGVFVAVPRFDSTNDWDDISVVVNAPLAKIITGLDFDGDPAADLLVLATNHQATCLNHHQQQLSEYTNKAILISLITKQIYHFLTRFCKSQSQSVYYRLRPRYRWWRLLI